VVSLSVDSKLEFAMVELNKGSGRGITDPRNKVGNLLVADGVAIIAGTAGPQSGPAAQVNAGSPAPILFPGMPTDGGVDATLDTSAQLAPTGHTRLQTAAGGVAAGTSRARRVVLFTGKARAAGHRPYVLTLVPTAAGRRTLKGHHRALSVRVLVSFKPKGRAKGFSVSKTFALPATG
jgi:hypothetical protein